MIRSIGLAIVLLLTRGGVTSQTTVFIPEGELPSPTVKSYVLTANLFSLIRWGMTKDALRDSVRIKPHNESADVILYKGIAPRMGGAAFAAFFTNDTLVSVHCGFRKPLTLEKSIAEYDRIRLVLEKQYHRPEFDSLCWTNDALGRDPSILSTALSLGYLIYLTKWSFGNTEIYLRLAWKDERYKLQIHYFERTHARNTMERIGWSPKLSG